PAISALTAASAALTPRLRRSALLRDRRVAVFDLWTIASFSRSLRRKISRWSADGAWTCSFAKTIRRRAVPGPRRSDAPPARRSAQRHLRWRCSDTLGRGSFVGLAAPRAGHGAIALIVGFALGYGVREWLSRRRRRLETE